MNGLASPQIALLLFREIGEEIMPDLVKMVISHINQQGRVYQRGLGGQTGKLVQDLEPGWGRSPG